MLAALAALLSPLAATADDAVAMPGLRNYSFGAVALGNRAKSINPDGMRAPADMPGPNLLAPEKSAERTSLIPDPQNSLERMLQSRELSFVPKRLDQDPRAANSNVDLAAIKLRVSRGSVILKAQFTFN